MALHDRDLGRVSGDTCTCAGQSGFATPTHEAGSLDGEFNLHFLNYFAKPLAKSFVR